MHSDRKLTIEDENLLSSVFSDGSPDFRIPAEPEPGDRVTIRIRIGKGHSAKVFLYIHGSSLCVEMRLTASDALFEYHSAELACFEAPVAYSFIIESNSCRAIYDMTGPRVAEKDELPGVDTAFRFTPGFHVPEWAKGAVQYQIFPDRFFNGNPDNDVTDREYWYVSGHSRKMTDWNALPDETDIRSFYGGDLQGILAKLDYLQELGVEAIYLNPIFISPSSHKYDTQDYEHIDPHLCVIPDDGGRPMEDWEKHNGYAERYIRRTLSRTNLEAGDAFFADFCKELHGRGMKLILDGVFNHCGAFHKWMDREGIYLNKPGYALGAYQSETSPFRNYFSFSTGNAEESEDYEGWWGYPTLPKLNYEGSEELREQIMRIAEKWASPPYSIDGWRLDVAADLGHGEEFNHGFWQEFRARLKTINPELLIIAEHYGDPVAWLKGDEWDTVMNYDAFMDPVSRFLTGMEKHSDEFDAALLGDGNAFFNSMLKSMSAFQTPSLSCAMNQLSNHDHSRFLTRTNRTVGRVSSIGSRSADENIDKGVFRIAAALQMTWPGAPTIYYGDEAGQTGWTDPDSRRTYPWGNEDESLINLYKDLSALRKNQPVLKSGSLKPLLSGDGFIAYSRFRGRDKSIIICNLKEESLRLSLRVADLGAEDGEVFSRVFVSSREGHSTVSDESLTVSDGRLYLTAPPVSASILINS